MKNSAIGFSSGSLVAEMSGQLDLTVAGFDGDDPLRIAFLALHPDGPSISYGLQALEYGARPKVAPEVWLPNKNGEFKPVTSAVKLREHVQAGLRMPPDDEAGVDLVEQLNRQGVPMVPLFPSVTGGGGQRIRATIDPGLDPDSVSPHNLTPPATPVGMVRLQEHIAGKPIKSFRGAGLVLGNGNVVGGPLVTEVLPAAGADMKKFTHATTREDIETAIKRIGMFDLVFSAFPAAGLIKWLRPSAVLIDAGYAIGKDGRPGGNASRELLLRSARRRSAARYLGKPIVTAFRGSCGPVTIAEVYDRAARSELQRRHDQRALATLAFAA